MVWWELTWWLTSPLITPILHVRITYKNLVYDLAHHKSPIVQWLECPTGWRVMGLTEYFDLRALLHCLHFIKVTNLFIIYSHLSFLHVEPCSMAGHVSHIQEPSIWPRWPWVSHSSGIQKVMGSTAAGFWVFRLESAPRYLHFFQVTNLITRKLFALWSLKLHLW